MRARRTCPLSHHSLRLRLVRQGMDRDDVPVGVGAGGLTRAGGGRLCPEGFRGTGAGLPGGQIRSRVATIYSSQVTTMASAEAV